MGIFFSVSKRRPFWANSKWSVQFRTSNILRRDWRSAGLWRNSLSLTKINYAGESLETEKYHRVAGRNSSKFISETMRSRANGWNMTTLTLVAGHRTIIQARCPEYTASCNIYLQRSTRDGIMASHLQLKWKHLDCWPQAEKLRIDHGRNRECDLKLVFFVFFHVFLPPRSSACSRAMAKTKA